MKTTLHPQAGPASVQHQIIARSARGKHPKAFLRSRLTEVRRWTGELSLSYGAAPSQRAQAAQRFAQLNEQGSHPATVVNTRRSRRSRENARAVALVRDARTVRRAFVASLRFSPPKAFGN